MKKTTIIFIFLFTFWFWQSVPAQTVINYNGTNEAVADMKNTLRGYKAGVVTVNKVSLENRTGQEFYLSSINNRTEIRYTTENSLNNAIYTYLHLLGFRWYGPGDNWFIKPKKLQTVNFPGKWVRPTFRNRSSFGSGGMWFSSPPLYDPQNVYNTKWELWKKRNRLGVDFVDFGHGGDAFYLDNKSTLDAHPEWFNSDQGKRQGRIRIENKAAVQLYKSWIRKRFSNSKSDFMLLGVDPADSSGGSDDPLPKNMPFIKNHADKWWWLANEVAKDYDENNNRVVISMYAYSSAAVPPSFPLRKNIYPIIIPYAFQYVYNPKELMIEAWKKKIAGKMGIYDYWEIPLWSFGIPGSDIYEMDKKLKYWAKNNIDGIYLETTYSAGPMGHVHWLASQLQWDVEQDFNKLYNQYLNDCFGKAAPVMKRMFDRWSLNNQKMGEAGFTLQDLSEAGKLVTKNSPEWKRINELKAYAHYMKLYNEHDGTKENRDNIFQYMYSIHHLLMVQTAGFVGGGYIDPGGPAPQPVRSFKRLSPEEIERQFDRDLQQTKTYQLSDFKFDFEKVVYTDPIPNDSWLFGGKANFYFIAPFTGTVQIEAGPEAVENYSSQIKISTNNVEILNVTVKKDISTYRETVSGRSWNLKKISFNIEKNKIYNLQTSGGNNRVKFITPGIVLFKNAGESIDYDNYSYPDFYFYVPKNTREIIFYDAQPEGTNLRGYLITPDGKTLKRESTGIATMYRVKVDPSQSGKVWRAAFGHPTWSFKNIPNMASLQKFRYNE